MKHQLLHGWFRLPSMVLGGAMVLVGATASRADLYENFNQGFGVTTTPVTLEFFNSDPGPNFGVQAFDGTPGTDPMGNSVPAGGMFQVTENGINDNRNYAYFDRTAEGAYNTINFRFDLRIGPQQASADGGSISFLSTNIFGEIGAPPAMASIFGVPEDPSQTGVLGIGFDTWANTGVGDGEDTDGGDGSTYNDVTLYFAGTKIHQFYDPAQPDVLPNGIRIDDDVWHAVAGTIDFANDTVSMTIDGLDVWNNLNVTDSSQVLNAIPDLTPFESRVMLGARTGGENENFLVDNLFVEYLDPTGTEGVGPQPPPTQGNWSVREWNVFDPVNGTAGADAVIADPNLLDPLVVKDGQFPIVNFADPQNAGGGYSIALAKTPFLSNTPNDDNDLVMRAISRIIIPEDGDYTFGIDGDDGTRLTITGADFTFQAGGGTAMGEAIEFADNTGNAFTLGSTFLAAGEYDAEVVWQERGGGAFVEVFAAPGVKTALDSDFSPVGQREEIIAAQGILPTTTGDWDIRFVDMDSNVMQLNNLTDAAAAIALGDTDPGVEFALNSTAATINFNDPDAGGGGGRIGGDIPIDGEFPGTDDNDFAVMATNIVSIAEDGDYLFGFSSDDGASLFVEGADFTILNPGGARAVTNNGQTMEFNANTGNSDTFGTTFLAAGEYAVEFLMWERGGGAYGEVTAGVGNQPISALSLRALGSPEEVFDLVIPVGLQLAGEPPVGGLEGDYNGNGQVEQGDLDLVLLNWGTMLNAPWVDGAVDQAELDGVLLNWGAVASVGAAAGVPEPSTAILLLVAAGLGFGLLKRR